MSGKRLYRAITRFFENLLAPGLCQACGCALDGVGSFCGGCRARLTRVPAPCQACGQPNPVDGLICPRCLLNPPHWQKLVAPFQYRGLVRQYLIELKYAEALHLGKSLCQVSFDAFRRDGPGPEVLLPVPLHRERLFERGYNQAREIARNWSQELDIPIDHGALSRLRSTPSQSGLSAAQRAGNVRGAFAYHPRREYRHVAIVDDIVTTGSTVTEITRLLHRSGVEYVEVWALARAYRP